MSFFHAITNGFKNYFTFRGTATRTQFWYWLLFVSLLICTALIADGAILGPMLSMALGREGVMPFDQDSEQPLSWLLLLILIVPTITMAGRRLQDSKISAKWLLIGLTGIGFLALLILFVKKGTNGPNPYLEQN